MGGDLRSVLECEQRVKGGGFGYGLVEGVSVEGDEHCIKIVIKI